MAFGLSQVARLAVDLARACLNMMPLPSSTKARLRQSGSKQLAKWLPRMHSRPIDKHCGTPPHSAAAVIGYRAATDVATPECRATVVAFYLPQYHPIPENDAWWGKGFTEWTNVTRAIPQFEGHAQPHLPGDLGLYDLRWPEVMQQQVGLARQHGIGAFCFYYYWFNGRRVLELPVRNYMQNPSLDLPFCLCWANEPWTRRWDGRDQDVLLEQNHDPKDDIAFIASVEDYLRDPRYLRIDGRPLLLIYRAELLPDPKATAARWRNYCLVHGIGDIHLACVESFERRDPGKLGFDSAIEFPPNLTQTAAIKCDVPLLNPNYEGEVLDWRAMSEQFRGRKPPSYRLFRGVNPTWDNEPRRPARGRSFIHAAPRRYEDWLRAAIDESIANAGSSNERLVFVNAWNEWAEGAQLEPDARLGHAWLQATRRAQIPARTQTVERPCVVLHAHYPEVLAEMLHTLAQARLAHRLIVTTSPDREADVRKALLNCTTAVELRLFENRGRDILPFLHIADELIDEGEQVVLKIHTKCSPHLVDGDVWRRDLLEHLLSPESARSILDAFEQDPLLGLVGPSGHLLGATEHAGGNEARVDYVTRRLGIESQRGRPDFFFAGSMYWTRLQALRPLMDAHLGPWEFEPELGQKDSTLAHAIERVIPSVVQAAGYRIAASSHPSVVARKPDTRRYRFAP